MQGYKNEQINDIGEVEEVPETSTLPPFTACYCHNSLYCLVTSLNYIVMVVFFGKENIHKFVFIT